MKIKIISLITVCFILLTGCVNRQLGLENMISPPNIDEQFNLIYSSLKQTVGENIKLKYPINGENQGASFFIDENQALIFYEWSLKGFNDNNVRINFLSKDKNKQWVSICDIGGSGSEIDKVTVLKDNYDNKYIAIGYILENTQQKVLKIYQFDGEMLNQIYSEYYINFEVYNLLNQGKDDVILTYKNQDNLIQTKIFNISNMEVSNEYIVNMNNSVYDYVNVTKGYFNSQQKALFFDGKVQGEFLSTQIIIFQDGKLVNLMGNTELFKKTIRDKNIYSIDYNNDEIVEVPCMFEYDELYNVKTTQRNIGFINWNDFYKNTYQTTFMDIGLGYILNLPKLWLMNGIVVKKTAESNEVVFIVNENQKTEKQIMKIKMYSNKDRNQFQFDENQFLIKEKGQFFYVGEILINKNDELFISKEQIIDNFYLYY